MKVFDFALLRMAKLVMHYSLQCKLWLCHHIVLYISKLKAVNPVNLNF